MEKWLKDAKDLAKKEAESFIEYLKEIANENCLEPIWFIEEVIKNIHNIKED